MLSRKAIGNWAGPCLGGLAVVAVHGLWALTVVFYWITMRLEYFYLDMAVPEPIQQLYMGWPMLVLQAALLVNSLMWIRVYCWQGGRGRRWTGAVMACLSAGLGGGYLFMVAFERDKATELAPCKILHIEGEFRDEGKKVLIDRLKEHRVAFLLQWPAITVDGNWELSPAYKLIIPQQLWWPMAEVEEAVRQANVNVIKVEEKSPGMHGGRRWMPD